MPMETLECLSVPKVRCAFARISPCRCPPPLAPSSRCDLHGDPGCLGRSCGSCSSGSSDPPRRPTTAPGSSGSSPIRRTPPSAGAGCPPSASEPRMQLRWGDAALPMRPGTAPRAPLSRSRRRDRFAQIWTTGDIKQMTRSERAYLHQHGQASAVAASPAVGAASQVGATGPSRSTRTRGTPAREAPVPLAPCDVTVQQRLIPEEEARRSVLRGRCVMVRWPPGSPWAFAKVEAVQHQARERGVARAQVQPRTHRASINAPRARARWYELVDSRGLDGSSLARVRRSPAW